MYWENQPELPSDKGSNWSRGATRDIGSPPFTAYYYHTDLSMGMFKHDIIANKSRPHSNDYLPQSTEVYYTFLIVSVALMNLL